MKALVLTGVKQFEIQNLPTPEIAPDEVLVNTAYAGVCGTGTVRVMVRVMEGID